MSVLALMWAVIFTVVSPVCVPAFVVWERKKYSSFLIFCSSLFKDCLVFFLFLHPTQRIKKIKVSEIAVHHIPCVTVEGPVIVPVIDLIPLVEWLSAHDYCAGVCGLNSATTAHMNIIHPFISDD